MAITWTALSECCMLLADINTRFGSSCYSFVRKTTVIIILQIQLFSALISVFYRQIKSQIKVKQIQGKKN
jgi:hypothetical protein